MNTLLATTPAPSAAAAPAVQIEVRGACAPSRRHGPDPDHHPVDETFTGALPPARRVLAFGCRRASLGQRYERTYPGSVWTDVDDLDVRLAPPADTRYDLLVLGDGLPAGHDAAALFEALARWAEPRAHLVVQLDNGATLETLERVIEADFTGTAADPGVGGHTTSSLYKLLMDAGWMPTLAGHRGAAAAREGVASAALAMADALDIPRPSARRALAMGQIVVRAQRVFDAPPAPNGPARFTVVVPTTRERQLRLNLEHSPGLEEVGARIVCCRHASSPAQALESSLPHCDESADWVLLCHQDVYFPRGFGHRLNEVLAAIPAEERDRTLIGFVGMGVNTATHAYEPAGFVIDRLEAADHPATEHAMSIDELAVVVSRRSVHRIDPAIGWHLWATDLCLSAISEHRVFPRIVRLPLFHNSVTDYELPDAFAHAAARLAAKHPSFPTIPTLCTTIDERFLRESAPRAAPAPRTASASAPAAPPAREPLPAQRVENGRDLIVDDVDAIVGAHRARGDHASALQAIAAGVHQTYVLPAFAHTALYYPQLDRHVEQLARQVASTVAAATRAHGQAQSFGRPRGTLLLATELYALGGHSRVLEDVSREVPDPVLVLTDLFDTYARQPADLEAVKQRFAHCTVVALPAGSCWNKSLMLARLTDSMQPGTVAYFVHHQDPIGFAGTLQAHGARKLLFHHGDHNPGLGCTVEGLVHVDLSEGVRGICAAHLHCAPHGPRLLPLHVPDLGPKGFAAPAASTASVVTSGHPAKFSRHGPIALQEIVRATLGAVGGRHLHVGPLPEDWVAEIRLHLAAHGIEPGRFVALGLVPSLWQTLKGLDAAVCIGSAPLGGGRAAVEAQGCGYPVAYFESEAPSAMADNRALYASGDLKWSTPEELGRVLQAALPRHAELSRAARALYLAQHSRKPFRKALQKLING